MSDNEIKIDSDFREKMTRLRQLESENQQLVYRLSHDLREPLRMVTSFMDLLSSRCHDQLDADANEYISYAVDGARRAEAMLDGLLEYSSVLSKAGEKTTIAARQSVKSIVGNLLVARDQADVKIRVDELPFVKADFAQWQQLWIHLLDNAFKFRSPQRELVVQIGFEDAGEFWKFICRDNGIGVDAEQSERIFMLFQRLHPVAEYKGTGIGLPVCRRIVERHGGQMGCDASVSEGALFWFTLPKSA